MEPTKEQSEAYYIYNDLSKQKKLDTIDPNTKKLALEYRAIYRNNRTEEQKQKKLEQDKKHYQDNREERLKYHKEKRSTEEHKAYMKEFRASEAGIKSARITKMKQTGIISDNYETLYEKFKNATHCEDCNVELVGGMRGANKKCTDHDHKTGAFRAIVCNTCNVKRAIVDNNIVAMTEKQKKEKHKAYYQANKERIKTERMQRYYQTHP
jgi:TPP-dependent indolepyruvate ferredoxin oxidoreductase alpha subunit